MFLILIWFSPDSVEKDQILWQSKNIEKFPVAYDLEMIDFLTTVDCYTAPVLLKVG